MNLTVPIQLSTTDVKKTLFKLKPIRRDGLLLSIHHSKANRKIRFLKSCFHPTGHIITSADNDGNLYIIDFMSCKFWTLPKLDSCTFIKFSSFNQNEILTGMRNGDIHLINSETGHITAKLIGHKYPVKNISFGQNIYCLSGSDYEAVIWDLRTNTKLQILALERGMSLKKVIYMPVSNNILVCFQDDLVQIWNSTSFESIKQFLPLNWKNFTLRSIAFSKNGQIMIIAGYLPILAVFLLDKWKLSKIVSLPEYINTIKTIEFIPQPFDGGCNKILAILAGQGIIYFYDIDQNIILSELISSCEILKIECCPNGAYVACILCSGEVELYNLHQYISPPIDLKVQKVRRSGTKVKFRSGIEKVELIRDQNELSKLEEISKTYLICAWSNKKALVIKKYKAVPIKDIPNGPKINNVLDSDKLKAILREYGEYPEAHRVKIWERLLQLPNNIQQYNSIINHVTILAFKNLYAQYPLESTITVKCLKYLLNNVVTWCPFFSHLDYLPVFAFPFVKVFQNKPVTCFEAICTIILNWCQHWFEYFPLPPMNILAIIENMLMEHEPELLYYLSSYNITTNLYAWTLLETAFSEILTASEWLMFWDHVLTNEPSFLLCAVVAYNIIHKNIIMCLRSTEEFELFYHNQNPNDMKKFLNKSYYILNNTSDGVHPRQYLETFKSIEMGNYPLFMEYPKTILNLHNEQVKSFNTELLDLNKYEGQLIEEAKRKWVESNVSEIEQEEERRQKEMSEANLMKIKKEGEKVKRKQAELQSFRKTLEKEEQKIFDRSNLKSKDTRKRSCVKADDVDLITRSEQGLSKLQEKLIRRYTELLKCKYRVKEVLKKNQPSPTGSNYKIPEKYQEKLEEETIKLKKSLASTESLKKLNIAASMVVLEKLMDNIEQELKQEPMLELSKDIDAADMRVKNLQMETEELEREVSKLLKLISKSDTSIEVPCFQEKTIYYCGVSCPKIVRFSKSASSLSDY